MTGPQKDPFKMNGPDQREYYNKLWELAIEKVSSSFGPGRQSVGGRKALDFEKGDIRLQLYFLMGMPALLVKTPIWDEFCFHGIEDLDTYLQGFDSLVQARKNIIDKLRVTHTCVEVLFKTRTAVPERVIFFTEESFKALGII